MPNADSLSAAWPRLLGLGAEAAFGRHGTREQHLLPEDAINDAYHALERVERDAASKNAFSDQERDLLRGLFHVLETEVDQVPLDGSIGEEELIERDPAWSRIREAARGALETLGFDLAAWERRQV